MHSEILSFKCRSFVSCLNEMSIKSIDADAPPPTYFTVEKVYFNDRLIWKNIEENSH